MSGATETRLFLAGRTLFLFVGERDFDGDTGSGAMLSGLKSCNGSTESPVLVLRVRLAVRGVGRSSVVLRRGAFRALFCGAGVNSSSLSSFWGAWFSSSSDESTTGAFRREAAARVDLRGDAADILSPYYKKFEVEVVELSWCWRASSVFTSENKHRGVGRLIRCSPLVSPPISLSLCLLNNFRPLITINI